MIGPFSVSWQVLHFHSKGKVKIFVALVSHRIKRLATCWQWQGDQWTWLSRDQNHSSQQAPQYPMLTQERAFLAPASKANATCALPVNTRPATMQSTRLAPHAYLQASATQHCCKMVHEQLIDTQAPCFASLSQALFVCSWLLVDDGYPQAKPSPPFRAFLLSNVLKPAWTDPTPDKSTCVTSLQACTYEAGTKVGMWSAKESITLYSFQITSHPAVGKEYSLILCLLISKTTHHVSSELILRRALRPWSFVEPPMDWVMQCTAFMWLLSNEPLGMIIIAYEGQQQSRLMQ